VTKLPRNISGTQLAQALTKLGYETVRQRGSHITVRTTQSGKHTLHIPLHRNLKPGMISLLLAQVQQHFGLTRGELLEALDM
jgi:predicted RNA binding protein YcfA (HicA-like mRNA interferase family)